MTNKLTLDLGLRWDYLAALPRAKNRWTFLNPTIDQSSDKHTGHSAVRRQLRRRRRKLRVHHSCADVLEIFRVRVSVSPIPLNNKTVIRSGFALVFTQAGGVGGRGGASNGTGQTGFNVSAIGPTESSNGQPPGPPYWLNGNSTYLGANANTAFLGASTTLSGGAHTGRCRARTQYRLLCQRRQMW